MDKHDVDHKLTGKEYEDACRIDEMIRQGLEQVDRDAKRQSRHLGQFNVECG